MKAAIGVRKQAHLSDGRVDGLEAPNRRLQSRGSHSAGLAAAGLRGCRKGYRGLWRVGEGWRGFEGSRGRRSR